MPNARASCLHHLAQALLHCGFECRVGAPEAVEFEVFSPVVHHDFVEYFGEGEAAVLLVGVVLVFAGEVGVRADAVGEVDEFYSEFFGGVDPAAEPAFVEAGDDGVEPILVFVAVGAARVGVLRGEFGGAGVEADGLVEFDALKAVGGEVDGF